MQIDRQTDRQREIEVIIKFKTFNCFDTWNSLSWMHMCIMSYSRCRSYHVHHHHLVELARTAWTLSLHRSRSNMAVDRSSVSSPVSSRNWSTGRPMEVIPCLGCQSNVSDASSSLWRKQCPANRILLSLMVVMTFLEMTVQSLYCWVFLCWYMSMSIYGEFYWNEYHDLSLSGLY
jgi:hypothetical protein